jgi:hypothetical protein
VGAAGVDLPLPPCKGVPGQAVYLPKQAKALVSAPINSAGGLYGLAPTGIGGASFLLARLVPNNGSRPAGQKPEEIVPGQHAHGDPVLHDGNVMQVPLHHTVDDGR